MQQLPPTKFNGSSTAHAQEIKYPEVRTALQFWRVKPLEAAESIKREV